MGRSADQAAEGEVEAGGDQPAAPQTAPVPRPEHGASAVVGHPAGLAPAVRCRALRRPSRGRPTGGFTRCLHGLLRVIWATPRAPLPVSPGGSRRPRCGARSGGVTEDCRLLLCSPRLQCGRAESNRRSRLSSGRSRSRAARVAPAGPGRALLLPSFGARSAFRLAALAPPSRQGMFRVSLPVGGRCWRRPLYPSRRGRLFPAIRASYALACAFRLWGEPRQGSRSCSNE